MSSIANIVTLFGSPGVLTVPAGSILCWLYWRRFIRAAAVFATTFGFAAALTFAIKWSLFTPGSSHWDKTSAIVSQYFPSGHVVLSSVVFGALGVIARDLGRAPRAFAYGLPILAVALIGWSRLAIQAHPLGDVLGGFVIGVMAVLGFAHFANLGEEPAHPIKGLVAAFTLALVAFAILPLPIQVRFE
jgi:undecaprenyl-diphosphatase